MEKTIEQVTAEEKLIVVKQLPEIEEHLQAIKTEVAAKVRDALSLVCTEETVKSVKAIRVDLNKELKDFEDRRRAVKKAILTPYEAFEAVYKDCISDTYKKADAELKEKIDSVENELKARKAAEVKAYFEEYAKARFMDIAVFENANINVTLSASLKSLKEQAKAFIDRICDDLKLIDTQEHKDEILYHYRKADGMTFLNASKAITLVNEKFRAIEEAKAREEARKAQAEQIAEAAAKAAEAAGADRADSTNGTDGVIMPPEAVGRETPVESDEYEKVYQVNFTVFGTLEKLKALKNFLVEGGYRYEQQ